MWWLIISFYHRDTLHINTIDIDLHTILIKNGKSLLMAEWTDIYILSFSYQRHILIFGYWVKIIYIRIPFGEMSRTRVITENDV